MNDSDCHSTWYSLRGLCLIFLCVHMCVCVWVCVWRLYTCMGWMPSCVLWSQRRMAVAPLCGSPPWSLEAGALTEPGWPSSPGSSPCLCFWKHWYCTHVWSHELLMWVTESWTKISMALQQVSFSADLSPAVHTSAHSTNVQVYCTPQPLSFSQEIENNQMYTILNVGFHCLQVEFKVFQGTKKKKNSNEPNSKGAIIQKWSEQIYIDIWCEDKIVSFFRDLTFRNFFEVAFHLPYKPYWYIQLMDDKLASLGEKLIISYQ